MPFVTLLRWWYGLGWRDQAMLVQERMLRTADFFSLDQIFRTFFSPFKQIDAYRVNRGPLDAILRGMVDSLFSRVFGVILRSVLVLIGVIALGLEVLVGGVRLLAWPLVPVLPLIAIIGVVVL